MQAVEIAVQTKVEPVEKLNAIRPEQSSAPLNILSRNTVSFLDRIEQARRESEPVKQDEKPAEKTKEPVKTSSKTSAEKEDAAKLDTVKNETVKNKSAENNGTADKKEALKYQTAGKKTVKAGDEKTSDTAKDGRTAKKQKTAQNEKADEKKDFSSELAYLQAGTESSQDPLEAVIAQAENYRNDDETAAKAGLAKAQRVSVETPQQFLAEQSARQKTVSAADDKTLALKDQDPKASKKKITLDKDGKIEVTDLRTQPEADKEKNVKDISSKAVKNIQQTGNDSAQMTMNLADTAQQNILSSNDQSASAAGSNFQAMLTNQIQENAGEFVKSGSIVLKDNNVGTINLVLHPESLGNVKISLQMTDKVVSGQITVASKEAYNAFKESADSLKQAFIQNGFETSGFDVSWSGAGSGGSFGGNGSENSGNFFNEPHAFGSYSEGQFASAASPSAQTSRGAHGHAVYLTA